MAVELNADLAKFQTFMSGLGRADSTSVQLGEDHETLGVATKTAGRLSRAISPFQSTSEARTENNRVRAEFLKALTNQFGGRIDKIPKSVMDVLNLKDYGLKVESDGTTTNIMSGKPLTARRISRVLTAVQGELQKASAKAAQLMESAQGKPVVSTLAYTRLPEDVKNLDCKAYYTKELALTVGLSYEELAAHLAKALETKPELKALADYSVNNGSTVMGEVIARLASVKHLVAKNLPDETFGPKMWLKTLDQIISDRGLAQIDGLSNIADVEWVMSTMDALDLCGLDETDANIKAMAEPGAPMPDTPLKFYQAAHESAAKFASRLPKGGPADEVTMQMPSYASMRQDGVTNAGARAILLPENPGHLHITREMIGGGSIADDKQLQKWLSRDFGFDDPSDHGKAVGAIANDIFRFPMRVKIGGGKEVNWHDKVYEGMDMKNVDSTEKTRRANDLAKELGQLIIDYIKSDKNGKPGTDAQAKVVMQSLNQNGMAVLFNIDSQVNKDGVEGHFEIDKTEDGKVNFTYVSDTIERKDGLVDYHFRFTVNPDGTSNLTDLDYTRAPGVGTKGSRSRIMDIYEGRATSAHYSVKANAEFRANVNNTIAHEEPEESKVGKELSEEDWGKFLDACVKDMRRDIVIVIGERRFGEGRKVSEQDIADFKAAVKNAFTKNGVTNHRAIRQFFKYAGQGGPSLIENAKGLECSPVPVLVKKSSMKDRVHRAGTEVRLTTDEATGEYRLDEDYYNEAGVMFSKNNVARQVDIDNTKSPLHDHYTYAFDGKGPARLGGDVTFDINLESNGVMDAFGA